MANSPLSKLKILYMYDYFIHEVDPSDGDGVTVAEIIDMLKEKTGEIFERKSIYSDISKINEYVTASKGFGKGDFIYHDGKRYFRGELADEILLDEARLISDSLRTTEFVPEQLYSKFEKMFPAFFNVEKNSSAVRLYSRYQTTNKSANNHIRDILTFFRASIEDKEPLRFTYGYKVTNTVVGSEFVVSPLVLDWTNRHYYLIAIDNLELYRKFGLGAGVKDDDLSTCIKRFRLDRIGSYTGVVYGRDAAGYMEKNLPRQYEMIFAGEKDLRKPQKNEVAAEYLSYHGFRSDASQKKHVSSYISNSFEGYSSVINLKTIRMSIEAADKESSNAWKNVLQAFSVLKDEFPIASGSIVEQEADKRMTFAVEAPDVPPLYKFLFSIYTFESVKFTIENEEIRDKFRKYIARALESLQ